MVDPKQDVYSRKYYRLSYPPQDRPTLMIGGVKYEVFDLSEEGVKFFVPGDDPIKKFPSVEGYLDFGGRNRTKIEGDVLRVTDSEMIIKLVDHLPLPLIMAEQRYLINTYKS